MKRPARTLRMRVGLALTAITGLFVVGCQPAAGTPDGGTITTGIPLSGCNGIGYSAPVQIGGQPFSLFLDTGASTIAVAAAGCSGCTGVTPTFTPDSITMSTGKTAMVSYSNDTGWSGPTATDAISLATVPSVQATFAEITTAKGFFQDLDCAGDMVTTSPIQGTLGLGPPALVVSDTQDYLTQLAGASALGSSFAVQFCPAGGGHLWFGGFDTAATTAAPQYAPMTASKYGRSPSRA